MSRETPANVSASITAKLHNLARQNKWNYNYLLLRYANERFLYRLSISPYSDKFVLKGSSLFIIWQNGNAYRHTMDADLLCFGESDEDSLKKSFPQFVGEAVLTPMAWLLIQKALPSAPFVSTTSMAAYV